MTDLKLHHPWKNILVSLEDAPNHGIKIGPNRLFAQRPEEGTKFIYERVNNSLPKKLGDWTIVSVTFGDNKPSPNELDGEQVCEVPSRKTPEQEGILDSMKELMQPTEGYSISKDRVSFFRDLDELRSVANHYGVPEKVWEDYTGETYGLLIQVDDILGGPDYRMLLVHPLPREAFMGTYNRLNGRDLKPSIKFAVSDNKRLLYAFILLHEIAHHQLKHGIPKDESEKERNEIEADTWAMGNLDVCKFAPA